MEGEQSNGAFAMFGDVDIFFLFEFVHSFHSGGTNEEGSQYWPGDGFGSAGIIGACVKNSQVASCACRGVPCAFAHWAFHVLKYPFKGTRVHCGTVRWSACFLACEHLSVNTYRLTIAWFLKRIAKAFLAGGRVIL